MGKNRHQCQCENQSPHQAKPNVNANGENIFLPLSGMRKSESEK
jgi:hypothetical protein